MALFNRWHNDWYYNTNRAYLVEKIKFMNYAAEREIIVSQIERCINCLESGWGWDICIKDWGGANDTVQGFKMLKVCVLTRLDRFQALDKYCLHGCENRTACQNRRRCLNNALTDDVIILINKKLGEMFKNCSKMNRTPEMPQFISEP